MAQSKAGFYYNIGENDFLTKNITISMLLIYSENPSENRKKRELCSYGYPRVVCKPVGLSQVPPFPLSEAPMGCVFIVSTGSIRILWFSVRYAAAARREIFGVNALRGKQQQLGSPNLQDIFIGG